MNLSGDSVSRLVRKYNIGLDDLIVIHDDLDLPLGKIRIRSGSSSGGHKGVDSIIACLGNRDFPRLRVGIGRPASFEEPVKDGEAVINYVLSDFTPEEETVVSRVVARASQALASILEDGLSPAMNEYN
jgi:PTH1 family peptidyl-tRNA hydrolase